MNSDEQSPLTQPPVDSTAESASGVQAQDREQASPLALTALEQQAADLKQEIATLQATKAQLSAQQSQAQAVLGRLMQESLRELEQRKQTLQIAVEQLERRQDRIQAEMRKSFAGVSQDLAIRVQGFKDYLVNSLQDLVIVSEQLDLTPKPKEPQPTSVPEPQKPPDPKFAAQGFEQQVRQVRKLLDQYRNTPNYYGPPWQLRRTFEPIHAERVANWFLTQGGRGALRSLGSRLQNILVAAAVVSILRYLYGNRLRSLILANSPERLGDWRRGLQDCLGISRADFGPDRGIVLFESPDSLTQKADRLLKEDQLPLILVDDSEDQISLSLLQYPLWLAFAAEPQARPNRVSAADWFE